MSICPTGLKTGTCKSLDCTFIHFRCDPCNIWCVSQSQLDEHNGGKRHQINVKTARVQCVVCQVPVMGPFTLHENGKRHLQRLRDMEAQKDEIPSLKVPAPPDLVHCTMCDRDILNSDWFTHLESPTHVRQEKLAGYSALLWDSEQNKCGVEVEEVVLDLGLVDIDALANKPAAIGTFHMNLISQANISLVEADMSSRLGASAIEQSQYFTVLFPEVIELDFGRRYSVDIEFTPNNERRRYDDRVELVFKDMALQQYFIITRPVRAIVGAKDDIYFLRPITGYSHYGHLVTGRAFETDIVDEILSPALDQDQRVRTGLPEALIPQYIRDALEDGSVEEKTNRVQRILMPPELHNETYRHHWKILLWIEEMHLTNALHKYDITGMIQEYSLGGTILYTLDIPGLSEKRPSVAVGDRVQVRSHDDQDQWHSGYVHYVLREHVHLRFYSDFSSCQGSLYDIRFELNRQRLRRMHMAVESPFYPSRILFPDPGHVECFQRPTQAQMEDILAINILIKQSQPQLRAVTAILNQPAGSVPFIVFGPPGTGKTVTIVEAIRQLLYKDRLSRILVCAPSSSESDLICEHLSPLGSSHLFRLNAPARLKSTLSPKIKSFCLENEGTFAVPSLGALLKYRVVVSTCGSSVLLSQLGVSRTHFTHIVIDNAGRPLEPETMTPIKTIGGPLTNVILSGDPKQLKPEASSWIARKLGIETSYLERLMKLPLYNDQAYNGVTFVKLADNFRNHSAILEFPNREFYRSQLKASGDATISRELLKRNDSLKLELRIIFHAIRGQDQQLASSPSFINPDEASMVRIYVQDLLSDTRFNLGGCSLGVISPYKGQCMAIRNSLRADYPTIKVGTVEEFQGQERQVIIISTVRSTAELISNDILHGLGFLAQPRRLNTAMTRAQSILVIIGNPDILGLDPLWRKFLGYIHQRGGWRGLAIPSSLHEELDMSMVSERSHKANFEPVLYDETGLDMDKMEELARMEFSGNVVVTEDSESVSNSLGI